MFAPKVVRPATPAASPARAVRRPPVRAHAPGPAWDFSATPVHAVQAKRVVGAASDPLEHEADRAAAAVMAMAGPVDALTPAPPQISRKCAQCDDEEVRAKPAGASSRAGGEAPASVDAALGTAGIPLDPATRAFFEPRFGRDFGGVRVHTDATAAASATAIGARAYTAGADIVFAAGQFAPAAAAGRTLIAHELAHVAQQGRADIVRRDFFTPVPANLPAHAEPALTAAEIARAVAFNNSAFRGGNIRSIQVLLGTPQTGTFNSDDIVAAASLQAEYGLKADGMIGGDTMRFLSNEQRLEGAGTSDAECLTFFQATPFGVVAERTAAGAPQLKGHHVVEAHFSARCNCAQFQYRQFIEGRATATRGGVVTDMAASFATIPGGLPASFGPDGKTQCVSPIYGDRSGAGEQTTGTSCPQDRYTNAAGVVDQAAGCNYRAEDFPKFSVAGLGSGDVLAFRVRFRGEIQRGGRTILTRTWTTVDDHITLN